MLQFCYWRLDDKHLYVLFYFVGTNIGYSIDGLFRTVLIQAKHIHIMNGLVQQQLSYTAKTTMGKKLWNNIENFSRHSNTLSSINDN